MMAKKISNPDKAKAWEAFAHWDKTYYCLKATGLPFVGYCITCGRKRHIRYLQAGHCLPGRSNAKLFDEKLVRPQCKYCNENMHGRVKKFEKIMIAEYGKDEFEKMKIAANKVIPYMDFAKIAQTYKDKYIKIMKDYGYKTWSELLQGQ